MTEYVTIKVPKFIAQQIDDMIKQNVGYSSRAELVKDAVRIFLVTNKREKSP